MTRLREHHRVALAQCDARMRVRGDPRQRAARLALAAGDDDEQIVVGIIVDLVFGDERREVAQIAAFARGRLQVAQAASDEGHGAAGGAGGERRGFDAGDVAREARHGDAPTYPAHQGGEAAADIGLRSGMALDHGVGRIADHGKHALGTEFGERRLVRRRSDQRRGIELPVAGVQNGAVRRPNDQRLRLGDRMGHPEELKVERHQVDRAAGRHDSGSSPDRSARPRRACGAAPRRRRASRISGSAAAAIATGSPRDDPRGRA